MVRVVNLVDGYRYADSNLSLAGASVGSDAAVVERHRLNQNDAALIGCFLCIGGGACGSTL